jgi:outer membrane protein OmpA-like peptidoglycan-associated protein
MRTAIAVLLLYCVASDVMASEEDSLRFIACPVYRDTDAGRKSGCWLATDPVSGRRYDVSAAPTKPDWNFEVLIEGTVSARQVNSCGGVVLDPVRVSVLPGRCARHMLPSEGYAGNKYVLPVRNVRPLSESRPQPKPPYTARVFHLLFDFDKAFIVYQLDDYLLDQAITYIRAVRPREVIVTGWAATEPSDVSGRRIAEKPAIAKERAEKIQEALVRLGVPVSTLRVRWRTDAVPIAADGADGLVEPSRRRVDIEVKP